jgi:hypothetical protein
VDSPLECERGRDLVCYLLSMREEVPQQYVDSNEHNDTRTDKLACERDRVSSHSNHRFVQVDISFVEYVRSFIITSPSITTHNVFGLIRPTQHTQTVTPKIPCPPTHLITPPSKPLLLLPKCHIQMIRSPAILVLRLLVGIDAGARDSFSFACI